MGGGPYRDPAALPEEPTTFDRLLARVRSLRPARSDESPRSRPELDDDLLSGLAPVVVTSLVGLAMGVVLAYVATL